MDLQTDRHCQALERDAPLPYLRPFVNTLPSHTTLQQFNTATEEEVRVLFDQMLPGAPQSHLDTVLNGRPYQTLATLKQAVHDVCHAAHIEDIVRWGTALQPMVFNISQCDGCDPSVLDEYKQLCQSYQNQFGWPFLIAACDVRGNPHTIEEVIKTLKRHLNMSAHLEKREALRQLQRIIELTLHERFNEPIDLGELVWDRQESLSRHSDEGFAEKGQLAVTYLTPAHQRCAQQIVADMRESGCDDVFIDAVGNVVGRYHGTEADRPMLMTGSHYDTVRNGGKYDGRLGIYVPLACIQMLSQAGRRLPYGIEVVAFSEEEGQRYKATFLASSALTGQFDTQWLKQTDADGISMQSAMQQAGLDPAQIATIKRDPARYLGFIEVHIEQGPVLYEKGLPLGVVTSINGSRRYLCVARGTASHAGTTPMDRRNDAACAVAELMLFTEKRALNDGDSVATVGMLEVPAGSVNVIPGSCKFSLDVRAPNDPQRDALVADIMQAAKEIGQRRGVIFEIEEIMQASAAPSDPSWQRRWEQAISELGVPIFNLPSGAGHDAMKIHDILPQAMLFVRGENGGISHNPLESTTAHDMDLAVHATMNLLNNLATELRT